VVFNNDKQRHLLMQPSDRLNKRQARYMCDLQPFMGAMSLAYRKGSRNEADPLSQRADFYAQARLPLFWNGDVPQSLNPRRYTETHKPHITSSVWSQA
jgi:hypothetical protein